MKTFNLEFEGFYREAVKASLPSYSGLYFVYRGLRVRNKNGAYFCEIKELLYIGQAQNVNERTNSVRADYQEWVNCLQNEEMLYYAVCKVEASDLDQVEAACIYKAQPKLNIKNKEFYKGSSIFINCSGNFEFIEESFSL